MHDRRRVSLTRTSGEIVIPASKELCINDLVREPNFQRTFIWKPQLHGPLQQQQNISRPCQNESGGRVDREITKFGNIQGTWKLFISVHRHSSLIH